MQTLVYPFSDADVENQIVRCVTINTLCHTIKPLTCKHVVFFFTFLLAPLPNYTPDRCQLYP